VGGFSLLEMVVAIAIMALALGTLYQAASGATRNVRVDEKYAYGVELARSLLADNAQIPLSGVRGGGETEGGFIWRVSSRAIGSGGGRTSKINLHHIEVGVSWQDGLKTREVVLNSVVEGVSQ
jgi:general secretion pathway protein I